MKWGRRNREKEEGERMEVREEGKKEGEER